MIAHTACSRLEPVPKFGPATRMVGAGEALVVEHEARGRRATTANRPWPKPVRSTRLSHSAGMIWSVSTSERSQRHAPCPRRCARPPSHRSSGVAKWPATAVAAATAGETRWVRPPRPWRPSKLRLLVDATARRGPACRGSWPGTSSSRAPASRPRRRGRPCRAPRPRPGASPRGCPGTTMHPSAPSPCRPSTTAAAARRSSMRELVQEPMNTVSTGCRAPGCPR